MKQLLIANPNMLKSDVKPETPSKVLVAPKGQRGKLAPQKPGESFAQFQTRLAEARAERAERARRYRARIKARVQATAEKLIEIHEISQEQAVKVALTQLPERIGVGIRLDVQAALTAHFRGFSHRRGNVRNNFLSSRLLNSLNQYRAMQLGKIHGPNGQLNISRGNPLYHVRMVDRSFQEHHTPNFGANAFVSGCTIQERLQGAETRALRKHDPLAVYSAHTQQEMLKWFEALAGCGKTAFDSEFHPFNSVS